MLGDAVPKNKSLNDENGVEYDEEEEEEVDEEGEDGEGEEEEEEEEEGGDELATKATVKATAAAPELDGEEHEEVNDGEGDADE